MAEDRLYDCPIQRVRIGVLPRTTGPNGPNKIYFPQSMLMYSIIDCILSELSACGYSTYTRAVEVLVLLPCAASLPEFREAGKYLRLSSTDMIVVAGASTISLESAGRVVPLHWLAGSQI